MSECKYFDQAHPYDDEVDGTARLYISTIATVIDGRVFDVRFYRPRDLGPEPRQFMRIMAERKDLDGECHGMITETRGAHFRRDTTPAPALRGRT